MSTRKKKPVRQPKSVSAHPVKPTKRNSAKGLTGRTKSKIVSKKPRVRSTPASKQRIQAKHKGQKQTPTAPAMAASIAPTPSATSARPVGLGRPKVSGDEKLYLLFKEDFHARQVFTFLGIETVRELEDHSAKEIIGRLTEPLRATVTRIRERLASYNRCLAEDWDFLHERQNDEA